MKKLMVTLALALACCAQAFAGAVWHSSTVRNIYPLANGDVVIVFDTDAPTCTNASSPKYHYVRVGENGMTKDGLKNILATALAAASMGKTVTINFDDATSGCFVNRLSVAFN